MPQLTYVMHVSIDTFFFVRKYYACQSMRIKHASIFARRSRQVIQVTDTLIGGHSRRINSLYNKKLISSQIYKNESIFGL